MTETIAWRELLDAKQQQEVAWATLYAQEFHHGTTGHNQLLLIARLAQLLDELATNGALVRPEPPASADIVLAFGKHNGKTLGEVYQLDSDYVRWLADKARDEEVRSAAQELLGLRVPAPLDDAPLPAAPGEDPPF